MAGKVSFWTIRHAGGFAVKQQGSREVLAVFERQQDAWLDARRRAGGIKEPPGFVPPIRSGAVTMRERMALAPRTTGRGPVRRSAA